MYESYYGLGSLIQKYSGYLSCEFCKPWENVYYYFANLVVSVVAFFSFLSFYLHVWQIYQITVSLWRCPRNIEDKCCKWGHGKGNSSHFSPLLRAALDNLGLDYWYLLTVTAIIIIIIIIIISCSSSITIIIIQIC